MFVCLSIEIGVYIDSTLHWPCMHWIICTTGKTYRLRISNVGLENSLNFRIQNHKMKLVEVEGTHTLQTSYSSLDVHVGQSYSVLVTADQPGRDYAIVVSSRFTSQVLTTTGVLRYSNSAGSVSGPLPGGPTIQVDWSLNQARSIRSLSTTLRIISCYHLVFTRTA